MRKLVSIGEVYLDSYFFKDEDEGAKTIGQPMIGENAQQIFENRRKVKGLLTPLGKDKLNHIVSEIKGIFKTEDVKAVWDRHCGCSMCPCSPGYRIKVSSESLRSWYGTSKNSNRFNIHITTEGDIFFKPKDSWMIGYNNVGELEKIFQK